MKSIKIKMMLVMVLVVALISGILAATSISTASKALVDRSIQALEDLAGEGAIIAEARIDAQFTYLEGLAKIQRLHDPQADLDAKMDILLEETEKSGFLRIGVSDLQGNLYLSDSYGIGGSVVDISEREYYHTSMDGQRAIMIPSVSVNPDDGGNVIMVYSVPLTFNNRIVGVLVAVGDGNFLSQIVDDMGYGESGYGYIIDQKGTIIGHPRRELVIEAFNPIEAVKNDPSIQPLASLFETIVREKQGHGDYFFNDLQIYAGFAPIANTEWVLAVVAEENEMLAEANAMRNLLIILAVVMVLMGALIAGFVGSSFASPIVELQKIIDRLANFDLTIEKNEKIRKYAARQDEIGQITTSLSIMQDNLTRLIKEIYDDADQVAASAEELTSTSQQSASAANEVAKTIEEIAKGAGDQAKETETGAISVNQLGQTIEKDQQLLAGMNDAVQKVDSLKDEGLSTMEDLVTKTQQSKQATQEVHQVILETSSSAEKIETASVMIRSIAEQTNLLALNAAIEAARAGEAGRGFAVVADEIRKLAEQSNRFTDEIASIVDELSGKVARAVTTMETVEKIVSEQRQSVESTHDKFEGITQAIDLIKKSLDDLNSAGKEMEEKKEVIIQIIENLSAISQENAAGTQEASASVEEQTAAMDEIANTSEELAKLAVEMQSAVSRFKF